MAANRARHVACQEAEIFKSSRDADHRPFQKARRAAVSVAGAFLSIGSMLEAAPAMAGANVVVHRFDSATEGSELSQAAVTPIADGSLYGTTFYSGPNGFGSVYKIAPSGGVTVLHAFAAAQSWSAAKYYAFINSDGVWPTGLVVGADGKFYGTATTGGVNGVGTVFSVSADGTFTTLHTFSAFDPCFCKPNADGAEPVWSQPLVVGADGALYGITTWGGAANLGTAFRVGTDGAFSVIHSFTEATPAHLIASTDGNLYGSLQTGLNQDSLFKLTPSGDYSIVQALDRSTMGSYVTAMTPGQGGTVLAATTDGAAYGTGAIFKFDPATQSLSVLHDFSVSPDKLQWQGLAYGGFVPAPTYFNADGSIASSLLQTADGTIYGGTVGYGPLQQGTLFKLTADGSYTVIFAFDQNGDGGSEPGPLAQDAQGNVLFGDPYASLYKYVPNAPLSVQAKLTPKTAIRGTPVTLSWSTTGAVSCNSEGYLPGLGTISGTSGRTTFLARGRKGRDPGEFFATVACLGADGSWANAEVVLTIK